LPALFQSFRMAQKQLCRDEETWSSWLKWEIPDTPRSESWRNVPRLTANWIEIFIRHVGGDCVDNACCSVLLLVEFENLATSKKVVIKMRGPKCGPDCPGLPIPRFLHDQTFYMQDPHPLGKERLLTERDRAWS
jgi:hypothetical protein